MSLEKLMYRLYVFSKIRKSEESIKAGRVVSHEEAKRRIDEWLR